MALFEPSSYINNTNNRNTQQEPQEQKKQENVNFIPIVHVKDIYKSFDYKDSSSSSSTIHHNRVGEQQQQLLNNPRISLSTSSHEVLNGVDLKISEGEFVTIVGSSGCGKSTLLNIIAGLDRPDSGSVFVRGEAVASNNTSSTKRIMIFQEGALFPWLNCTRQC